ncbi:hypothetical protein L1889_18060 [Paenalcaligenes niemegkensis]|uniref:hypothetical protein n=1 Tax=Paenalcaligenes niemegkensis TaxID=2895469 RepID=UPI001EE8AB48|nr:hypothetical protein [Paenalcaligenes niemegkensis]MCQ9618345.1 hypothetical protein [Paenalcaligenes niemegkensis]
MQILDGRDDGADAGQAVPARNNHPARQNPQPAQAAADYFLLNSSIPLSIS